MVTHRDPATLLLALASPIAIPLLVLLLHQSGVITIPWPAGGVVVFLLAGFLCGALWRSWWAVGYLIGLWVTWGTVAIATDDGRYDPPAVAVVLASLSFFIVPAIVAAILGIGMGRMISDE